MRIGVRDWMIGVVVVGIAAYVALLCGCFGSTSYTPDSVSYLRMAECVNGNTQGEGWFAIWPVGYPVVIAGVSALTGLDGFVASKVVSVLATIGLLMLFWKYARTWFPVLALALVNLAYLKIYRSTLSEHLFVPVLVWIAFVMAERLKGGEKSGWSLVLGLAGPFIAAYFARYFGFLVPGWCIGVTGLWWLWARTRRRFRILLEVVGAAVLAWVVDGGYMLVNWLMAGSVSGYTRGGVTERGAELVRMVVSAEVHELQAYGILAVILLALLALRLLRRMSFAADVRGMVFMALGLCYHVSMIGMRSMRSFDVLGFRLLYPGTLLIVIGLVLCLRLEWSERPSLGRWVGILLVLALVGSHLLELELGIRRSLGISTYTLGAPYPELKSRLLSRYAAHPPHATISRPPMETEDYMILALRPDLKVQ